MIQPLTLSLLALAAAPAHMTGQDRQAVMAPIDAFFSGMSAAEPERMRAVILRDATGTVVVDGKARQIKIADFIDQSPQPGERFEEKMIEPAILIDGDIAAVWGAYRFTINGAVHHCGTDLFDLVKQDGQWKIAAITWNQRTDCAQ